MVRDSVEVGGSEVEMLRGLGPAPVEQRQHPENSELPLRELNQLPGPQSPSKDWGVDQERPGAWRGFRMGLSPSLSLHLLQSFLSLPNLFSCSSGWVAENGCFQTTCP